MVFVKGLAFGNFGSHYFHASQIFDKQLGELPYLQYLSSVSKTLKDIQLIAIAVAVTCIARLTTTKHVLCGENLKQIL
jgi:hypothetical protein